MKARWQLACIVVSFLTVAAGFVVVDAGSFVTAGSFVASASSVAARPTSCPAWANGFQWKVKSRCGNLRWFY